MKIFLTGHQGYIGSVMVPVLERAGHTVCGFDSNFFIDCTFGEDYERESSPCLDIRDIRPEHLAGFDAVVHLAALSNDPLGDLNADCTYEINHKASVRLAESAKAAGVGRFVVSSSCSLYGVSGDDVLTEEADFNPITPYGISKVRVEQDVSLLADSTFSPVFLRNATAYGVSPRLRADVVVNNLVGYAFTTGIILIKSDGTPWRPLVHVEDICLAFLAVLEAPKELVHNQAFNVGDTSENFRVSEIAELIQSVVPHCSVSYAEGAGPDPRSYRVSCEKLRKALPNLRIKWKLKEGIEELYEAYKAYGLTEEEFLGSKYLRIKRIQKLQSLGKLDPSLRWR